MDMTELQNHAVALVALAVTSHDSADAMRLSQAANNVANTICALRSAEMMLSDHAKA